MSTPKEIFLETIKPNGQPERLLRQYEPFYMCLGDPVMCYLDGPDHIPGKTSVNPWGITISFPENAPGSMPVHGPGLTVCPDITRWKETVHAPDLAAHCSEGWEEFRARCVAENNNRQMLTGFMAKESVVSSLVLLFGSTADLLAVLTPLSAASLLVFSLLYTPCIAAVACIRRELGARWAVGVVLYQCAVAWVFALIVRLVGLALI